MMRMWTILFAALSSGAALAADADRKLDDPGRVLDQPLEGDRGLGDDGAVDWEGAFAVSGHYDVAWGTLRPGLSWHWDPLRWQVRYLDAAVAVGWGFSPQLWMRFPASPLSESPYTEDDAVALDVYLETTTPVVVDISYHQGVGDHYIVPRIGPAMVAHWTWGSVLTRDDDLDEDEDDSSQGIRQSVGSAYVRFPLYVGLDLRFDGGFLIRTQGFLGPESSVLLALGKVR